VVCPCAAAGDGQRHGAVRHHGAAGGEHGAGGEAARREHGFEHGAFEGVAQGKGGQGTCGGGSFVCVFFATETGCFS